MNLSLHGIKYLNFNRMMVYKQIISLLFTLLFFLILSGCSPTIKGDFSIPSLGEDPVLEVGGKAVESVSEMQISEVKDLRESPAVVRYRKKEAKYDRDITPAIRGALQERFRKRGFDFSDTAPLILNCEVQRWEVDIHSGFKFLAEGNAFLYLEVLDPANKRIYSGAYEGLASYESISMGTKDIEKVLQSSMRAAMDQIFEDKSLLNLIKSF